MKYFAQISKAFFALLVFAALSTCNDDDVLEGGPGQPNPQFIGAVYAMTNGDG